MKKANIVIENETGLHARPATALVNAAMAYECDITLSALRRTVDFKSIMGVMSLGIPTQSEISISAEGEDADQAIEAIVEVLQAQKVIA